MAMLDLPPLVHTAPPLTTARTPAGHHRSPVVPVQCAAQQRPQERSLEGVWRGLFASSQPNNRAMAQYGPLASSPRYPTTIAHAGAMQAHYAEVRLQATAASSRRADNTTAPTTPQRRRRPDVGLALFAHSPIVTPGQHHGASVDMRSLPVGAAQPRAAPPRPVRRHAGRFAQAPGTSAAALRPSRHQAALPPLVWR